MTHYTVPSALALALAIHLTGCDKTPTAPRSDGTSVVDGQAARAALAPEDAAPTPTLAPVAMSRDLPGPTDRDPRLALAYWREAMEGRNWAAARSVFGEFGAQSGMTPEAFAVAWGRYRIVDVTIGPGEQDAGAGSVFYEAPVTITGLTTDNRPYKLTGQLSLRRVNDVAGASPEQLRWHIERATLYP